MLNFKHFSALSRIWGKNTFLQRQQQNLSAQYFGKYQIRLLVTEIKAPDVKNWKKIEVTRSVFEIFDVKISEKYVF